MEENKKISEMTEKEILRQQLELLAETSQGYDVENLPEYTKAMIGIYDRMNVQHNYIPYEKSIKPEQQRSKAERMNEQLLEGKRSLNEAREEYGLNPTVDGNVYQMVVKFLRLDRDEAEKALRNEKKQVCIKSDSYMAKEIKYQTALLHEVLSEVRKRKEPERWQK